jgi:hypothetical protein
MRYLLTEEYFKTEIFQTIAQEYFDTVLNGILNFTEIIQAKGLYAPKGEVIKDYYDMLYHIHILNGLIPAMLVYEKFLLERKWIKIERQPDDTDAELYIKAFVLGFTFHDANKLTGKDKWEDAIIELDKLIDKLRIYDFFKEFVTYRNDVYYLALNTEDRSSALSQQFNVSLDYKHLTEVIAELCHFADGIASIQELDGIEVLYKEVNKTLGKLKSKTGIAITISYIKILENPYTLLSQNLMNTAAKVLKQNERDIFYIMRDGFIFFGNDLKGNEKQEIFRIFEGKNNDLDIQKLIKIDAQKCDLSAVVSIGINTNMLDDIIDKRQNSFLLLSPNGPDKIKYFDDFVKYNENLIQIADLQINRKMQNGKFYLNFSENAKETRPEFVKVFSLLKLMWLNSKSNKAWEKDFKDWTEKTDELPIKFECKFQINENEFIALEKFADIKKYFETITNSSSSLLKTYIAIFKTISILNSFEDIEQQEDYIENLYTEIEIAFQRVELSENSLLSEFYKKYFTFKGNTDFSFLNDYLPNVPEKKEMCAFTAQKGTEAYVDANAFGMNARGFSNRTVASLKNTTSFVSPLFAEENKLRKSAFARPKSNTVVYYDFFETTLDIEKDLIKSVMNAKNHKITDKGEIQFNNSAKFQYSLNNMEFVELSDSMNDIFYFVWKHLLFVKNLGIRSYITGLMSPYRSHKEVFLYENAPRFIKDLGWDRLRLQDIDRVLEERDLLYSIGKRNKSMDSGFVLRYAESPNSIFKSLYLFAAHNEETVVNGITSKLNKFINKYPTKFKGMTVIEKLVETAQQIDSSAKSGSEETWLIRTALDFLRKNVKEKLSKEDTIQQIAGNIYKTLRLGYVDTTVIERFARLVYEELYEKEWKNQLPTLNRQKDWIYQFGFVFKQKSVERMRFLKAEKIKKEIEQNQLPMNKESIIAILKKDKLEKYADEYIQLILK